MTLSNLFLALFLLCYGLLTVTNFRFEYSHVVLGVLALVAGVLFFAKK